MKPLWITAYDEAYGEIVTKHFLRSFSRLGLRHDFELLVTELPGQYGTYGEDRYLKSYRTELRHVLLLLEQNIGRIVVWSDADLHLYRNPWNDIIGKIDRVDVMCQMDNPTVRCTGFQAFLVTPRILKLFRAWLKLDEEKRWGSPQESYNVALAASGFESLPLPDKYWTIGLSGSKSVWSGEKLEDIPDPPNDIVLHHGNFTVGVENKLRLMDEVERRMQCRA